MQNPQTARQAHLNPAVVSGLIAKIKSKKELANLDNSFCMEKINRYLAQNRKAAKKIGYAGSFRQIERSKEADALVKSIRSDIRRRYGVFQTNNLKEAGKLLDELEKALQDKDIQSDESLEIHKKLLGLHLSTKERLDFYPEFFGSIFRITGKPNSILDIASGFNPMAFPYMEINRTNSKDLRFEYDTCELNKDDADLTSRYMKIARIRGKAFQLDLTKEMNAGGHTPKIISSFEDDIMFAFKIFDILSTKQAEAIIKSCRCRWIAASFPIKTISEKMMRFPRRGWFQKMLRRLKYKYQTLVFRNEIVYVFKTEKQGEHDK